MCSFIHRPPEKPDIVAGFSEKQFHDFLHDYLPPKGFVKSDGCNSRGEALNQQQRTRYRSVAAVILLAGLSAASSGCAGQSESKKRIEPVYDAQTGKLQLLKYDSDGDGKIDTWCYMDGTRVIRIEIDTDGDGKIDRWEYYGAGQRLERVGISTRRDGTVNRTEYYENDKLVRAEEDSDDDGKVDKWETYDGPRLSSVAFDTTRRGSPDRRLLYRPDGSARLEVDTKHDGRFVSVREN
jgi:hypothetical protein